ncbi:MAG: site-2 protease family protein [Clostridia bacterium]|nr:site-2 protease family protein [Clostridia bacterium]
MGVACSLSFLAVGVYLLTSARRSWLLLFWLAAILHEMGHLAALRLLRGRVEGLCFRLSGAEIRYRGTGISYGGEALLALAGPGMNLLCAALGAAVSHWYPGELLYRFIGCHLVLALFNLLPALPLDGGRVLQSALEARFPLEGALYVRRVSGVVGAVLFLLGVYVLLKNGNPTLFSAGGVILLRSGAKRTLHLPEKLLKYKFKL